MPFNVRPSLVMHVVDAARGGMTPESPPQLSKVVGGFGRVGSGRARPGRAGPDRAGPGRAGPGRA
eukprot:11512457-Alexandrium_andersonii.AAC.2